MGGPVFNLAFLAIPLGAPLMAVGLMLHTEQKKSCIWPVIVVCAFLILTGMYPSRLAYYPTAFGILGGLIVALFIATLWYWAKKRGTLQGMAKTAADYRIISYIFFLVAAGTACAILGNPFFGLYFPEKLLESKDELMPMAYSAGIKLAVYFTLGWLFTFLSQYKATQESEKEY